MLLQFAAVAGVSRMSRRLCIWAWSVDAEQKGGMDSALVRPNEH